MRTFIAIELSAQIHESLAQIQAHLKYSGADVKWVENNNIHLTLKFLGEVDDKKVEEVKANLEAIAKETRPFEITLKDVGAFPKIDYPRVIWAGLDKGVQESKVLAEKIDEALSGIGFEKEARPFAAHLTIGRVRSPKNKAALKEKILSLHSTSYAACPKQSINSIFLFQSTLTPSGSIYTKLHEALLQRVI
ncbi:MAG: 2'-5' RNA ligase [Omnitrophica bacterium RIFCSPLOWO2_01_FULL_45_10]|nr:MAG: 2'-5' RNA ligase [Omnitrophica bacterium RIFCSPLOWO2_01_FULL_45_10]